MSFKVIFKHLMMVHARRGSRLIVYACRGFRLIVKEIFRQQVDRVSSISFKVIFKHLMIVKKYFRDRVKCLFLPNDS